MTVVLTFAGCVGVAGIFGSIFAGREARVFVGSTQSSPEHPAMTQASSRTRRRGVVVLNAPSFPLVSSLTLLAETLIHHSKAGLSFDLENDLLLSH